MSEASSQWATVCESAARVRSRRPAPLPKAERIGFEESCKLAWKRGGMRRLVIKRIKYRAVHTGDESVTVAAAAT
jgi:hypothetical protein